MPGALCRNEVVLARDDLLASLHCHSRLCDGTSRSLAVKLGVTPLQLSDATVRFSLQRRWWCLGARRDEGRLNRAWTFSFHGFEIRFVGRSGCAVEVCLGYAEVFDVVDPYFWADFVSRPWVEDDLVAAVGEAKARALVEAERVRPRVDALLQRDFHRASLALDVLEELGDLERVAPQDPSLRHPGVRVRALGEREHYRKRSPTSERKAE